MQPISFVCAENNDLYRLTLQSAIASNCYQTLEQAIAQALPGSGLLLLADTYPVSTAEVSPENLQTIRQKQLRVYVEYPAKFPQLLLGEPRPAEKERVAVTSEFFASKLPRHSLVTAHGCWVLPMQDPTITTHLALAKMAGYHTAVYGVPANAIPLLLQVQNDVLIATTKLSSVITSRYAPVKAWHAIWQTILGWLVQDDVTLAEWLPLVHTSLKSHNVVTPAEELGALKRSVTWFNNHIVTSGYNGKAALEGVSSAIDYHGQQKTLATIRADCTAETALVFAYSWVVQRNPAHRLLAQQLLDRIWLSPDFYQGNPDDPTYGLVNWYERMAIFYGDDNARVILPTLATAALLHEQRWNEQVLCCLLANLRTTGKLGFRRKSIRGSQFPAGKDGWRMFRAEEFTVHAPHYEAYLWACFLWAYALTGYDDFLVSAKSAIYSTMQAYPRWRWTNGITQEIARMILPLAFLVRVDDTAEHRGWLQLIVTDLLQHMQSSGAIYESMGPRELGSYPSPKSNADYGTNEASIIQENGDPACDLLYTANFALLGLHEAVAATGNLTWQAAENKLAEFLCRIQVSAPQHPYLDGAWLRSFDDQLWEYWGSSADAGWGAWCAESGWTNAWIASILGMRLTGTTLFSTELPGNLRALAPGLVKLMMD